MPVRVSQPASYSGGRALIEVLGSGGRVAEPVEIAVLDQMGGAEKATHLDPRTPEKPWKTPVFWFAPESVRRDGERLAFDLDHGVTFHLRPNVPYLLRLRGVDGTPVEERMVWRPMRGKSAAPGWTPPAAAKAAAAPVPTPAPEPEPPAAEPPPPEPIAREPLTPSEPPVRSVEPAGPSGGRLVPLLLALLLLLGAGGAAWWFLLGPGADRTVAQRDDPPPPPPPPPLQPPPPPPTPRPTTVEEARRLVQEQVPAADALAEAKRFAGAGGLDGAFLLYRRAAEAGNAEAAVALGAMYDPATHAPSTSPLPAPNPDQAAAWYRRAAEAGDAEAQFRLGRLLMGGATSEPSGPEKGTMWLRKAAEQGHAGARDALPK